MTSTLCVMAKSSEAYVPDFCWQSIVLYTMLKPQPQIRALAALAELIHFVEM